MITNVGKGVKHLELIVGKHEMVQPPWKKNSAIPLLDYLPKRNENICPQKDL